MRPALGLALLLATATGQDPSPRPATVLVHEALDAVDPRWQHTTAIPGLAGQAAHFDDERAHIDLGPCPVGSDRPFTLRCALRTTRAAFCTPLMARDGNAVGLSLVMGRRPGCVSFEAWSWQSVRLVSRRRIDDGTWHRIEVSYDPGTRGALLTIDGAIEAYAVLGDGAAATARLRLGNNIGAHQPFVGDLDELEVTATCTHAELFGELAPVIPDAGRRTALARLREQVLPRATPSLTEEAAADWPTRRLQVRHHVADALGLLPPPPAVPFDVEMHGELRKDGVRLQRVSWVGFPGQRATGWLWSPDPMPAGRLPTVLCPHGHWHNGATHPVVQARCAAFARFGWLALAVDSVHVEDVASGVNSVGAMTWHNQRAIGWLRQRDDVDPDRIAVTGASGGGQQSYYLMALEDRLAAAAPIVMACYLTEILDDTSAHCGCNHTPRLAAGTDVPEMCAVFAPRPAFFGSVTGDWTQDFPRHGLPELLWHWRRLDGNGPWSRHADEGHNYDRPMREAVYGFLHDVLLGPAPGGAPRARVDEPAGGLFEASELEPLLRTRPPAQLDHRAMAREYLARRPAVTALAALAPGLDFDVRAAAIRWHDDDAREWRRGSVTGSDGVPIPLRHRRSEVPGEKFTVIVDPRGAAMARAAPHPQSADWTDRVLVDPRPYGEWQPFRAAWQRNGLLLGRGEGYQTAIDIALVCQSLPGEAPIRLVGYGEAGVSTLLAARLCARIHEVVTDELGGDFAVDGNRPPLCPELLRWRDVPALVTELPAGVRHTALPTGR